MDLVTSILWITGVSGLIVLICINVHCQKILAARDDEINQLEAERDQSRYDLRWETMLRESADECVVTAKGETEAYRVALIDAETRMNEGFELNLKLAKARMDADNARIAIRNEADEQIRDLRGTIEQLSMATQMLPIQTAENTFVPGVSYDLQEHSEHV